MARILIIFPQHPKRNQNLKFTILSETTSILTFFIFKSSASGGRATAFYVGTSYKVSKKRGLLKLGRERGEYRTVLSTNMKYCS